jgi:predicted ArsR family transcriptional regulator
MHRKRPVFSLTPVLVDYLHDHGPCTSYDMAAALQVKPRSVSKAMNRLVRDGVVRRSARLAKVTTHAVWELVDTDDELPQLRVRRPWRGVGEWVLDHFVPRTSVFDNSGGSKS